MTVAKDRRDLAIAQASALMAERRRDYQAANEWQEIAERLMRNIERKNDDR